MDLKQNVAKEKNNPFVPNFVLNGKITAVVGLSKNAGKTTFLNWLVANSGVLSSGIITTGRDGEEIDLVGGHKKPKVFVPAGSYYTTFSHETTKQSPFLEIQKKLSVKVNGKPLYIVKATQNLNAEIIGPASVKNQISVADELIKLGAEHIFIDGALDRKSIVLSSKIDNLILVGSPFTGKLDNIKKEFNKLKLLSEIPNYNNINPNLSNYNSLFNSDNILLIKDNFLTEYHSNFIFGNEKELISIINEIKPDAIFLPAALTEKSFPSLRSSLENQQIMWIIKHPINLKVKFSQLEWIIKNVRISTLNSFRIDCIAVNSYATNGNHIDCEDLRLNIKEMFKNIPVIDVKEAIIDNLP